MCSSCRSGRLLLGLGSQIKPHITRRFSMPWSHPAPRMREYILAMRAIWDCWNTGSKLDFRGEFYTHTLMTPFFNPGPNPYGPPRYCSPGSGEVMTAVAGEVADGFLCHGFTTERYLREVTVPALASGRSRTGADLAGYEVSGATARRDGNDSRGHGRRDSSASATRSPSTVRLLRTGRFSNCTVGVS